MTWIFREQGKWGSDSKMPEKSSINKPFDLKVNFDYMSEPSQITIYELNKLVSYLQKISNSDYKFTFHAPSFINIINKNPSPKKIPKTTKKAVSKK